jgi:thiamine-monophosphate kinase
MENNSLGLTSIASLGEFGLIDRITDGFILSNGSVIKGPGDDCAVMEKNDKEFYVVSTDILAEGVHFDLSYSPLKHLGYKAVAVNVSDIAAMNGTCTGILVSIGMSNRFSVEAVDELYSGIRAACNFYQIALMGGDCSSSKQGLFLSITAIGVVPKDRVTYRHGAREHDLICVSGTLGASLAGLKVLQREKQVFLDNPGIQPDLSGFEFVVEKQLKPEARTDVVVALKEYDILPTAMMDISDGLSSDLLHICKESKCGALIYQGKLPVDYETDKVAESFDSTGSTYALNGGEDYELLFTVPLADFEKLKQVKDISVIGHITAENAGVYVETADGMQVELTANGWSHF